MNRKKIIGWAKLIIIMYCSIGIAIYYLQEKFLFRPKELDTSHKFRFEGPYEELFIPVNSTDTISLVKFFTVDTPRKGLVIYFHGNKDNVEHYAPFVKNFTERGYEVWMPDYPGYGKSRGKISEQKLYDQALMVRKMAAGKFSAANTIIYGKSLGSGIAAFVASLSDNSRLMLETPYSSIPKLMDAFTFVYPTSYMSTYKLPTWNYLQDVREPVTIFHGDNDWVVPYRCAALLKQYLKPGDEFVTLKGGTHNNLTTSAIYQQKLDSLLAKKR